MKAQEAGRKAIKAVNGAVNTAVLMIVLLLLAFAGYALWDAHQIYHSADKAQYAAYKPTAENEGVSFQELRAINPEVFAWLTVYGTNVDYPVTQAEDNQKYISTNVEGKYSMTGSIFLDKDNSMDFSDFNSIMYGHHMEKNAMFGEIDTFADMYVFETHRYGNLYFSGKDHGIEFFAFVHADAYDTSVYRTNVMGDEARQAYLDGLFDKSVYKRDIGVTTDDHIVLLSTCSSSSTNGRDILVGRLSGEVYDDPFAVAETNIEKPRVSISVDAPTGFLEGVPSLLIWALFITVLLLAAALLANHKQKKKKEAIG